MADRHFFFNPKKSESQSQSNAKEMIYWVEPLTLQSTAFNSNDTYCVASCQSSKVARENKKRETTVKIHRKYIKSRQIFRIKSTINSLSRIIIHREIHFFSVGKFSVAFFLVQTTFELNKMALRQRKCHWSKENGNNGFEISEKYFCNSTTMMVTTQSFSRVCVWSSNHLLREAAAAANRTQFVINVIFCHLSFHFSKLRNEMCHTQPIRFHSQSHYSARWRHLINLFIIANGVFSNKFNSSYWANERKGGMISKPNLIMNGKEKEATHQQPAGFNAKQICTNLINYDQFKVWPPERCVHACMLVGWLSCLFIGFIYIFIECN